MSELDPRPRTYSVGTKTVRLDMEFVRLAEGYVSGTNTIFVCGLCDGEGCRQRKTKEN